MGDFLTILTTVAGLAAAGLILGFRPLPIMAGVVVAVAVPSLLNLMNFSKVIGRDKIDKPNVDGPPTAPRPRLRTKSRKKK